MAKRKVGPSNRLGTFLTNFIIDLWVEKCVSARQDELFHTPILVSWRTERVEGGQRPVWPQLTYLALQRVDYRANAARTRITADLLPSFSPRNHFGGNGEIVIPGEGLRRKREEGFFLNLDMSPVHRREGIHRVAELSGILV